MKKIDELYQKKMLEFGFGGEEICSDEECEKYHDIIEKGGTLPDDIRQSTENKSVFLRKRKNDLSEAEMIKLMWLYLFNNVTIIKKCVVFLTIIVAALLAFSIIAGISIGNAFSI